jgi:prolyl oligopeptidase PreP (S9A serine peptidase family)
MPASLHGVTVNDPYRWLENPQDPVVQAWIKAQKPVEPAGCYDAASVPSADAP